MAKMKIYDVANPVRMPPGSLAKEIYNLGARRVANGKTLIDPKIVPCWPKK